MPHRWGSGVTASFPDEMVWNGFEKCHIGDHLDSMDYDPSCDVKAPQIAAATPATGVFRIKIGFLARSAHCLTCCGLHASHFSIFPSSESGVRVMCKGGKCMRKYGDSDFALISGAVRHSGGDCVAPIDWKR